MFAITRIATVMSAFVASTLAQSSTITTSLLFGDSMSADQYAWGGSVVAAQSDRTTFAVNCVSNCGPLQGYTVTLVEGPAVYQGSFSTNIQGQNAAIGRSCSLGGTTYAACVDSITVNVAALTTGTVSSTTLTSLGYVPVTLTAGVSKLAAATSGPSGSSSTVAVLTPTGNAAAAFTGPKSRAGEWMALTVLTCGVAVLGGLLVVA